MRWWAAALAVACHAASVPPVVPPAPAKPVAQAPSPFPEVSPFRLPHTFEPKKYRLRIALGETRFTGHVEIEGELSEAVHPRSGLDFAVKEERACLTEKRQLDPIFRAWLARPVTAGPRP